MVEGKPQKTAASEVAEEVQLPGSSILEARMDGKFSLGRLRKEAGDVRLLK